MIPGWIDLGRQTEVAAEEVVGVHEGCTIYDYNKLTVRPADIAHVRAIVVLRRGGTMPCYITAPTLRARLARLESMRLAALAPKARRR